MRQHLPLAATPVQLQERIEYLAISSSRGRPPRLLRGAGSKGSRIAHWASEQYDESGHKATTRLLWAQQDVDLIQRGLGILSDICWAAGAEVDPARVSTASPTGSNRSRDAEVLRTRRLSGRDTISAGEPRFGTTRMSRRPEDGVVDEDGRCHDLDNVFIADTGIFPGSPAVNPMLTCMALADRIAERIAAPGEDAPDVDVSPGADGADRPGRSPLCLGEVPELILPAGGIRDGS